MRMDQAFPGGRKFLRLVGCMGGCIALTGTVGAAETTLVSETFTDGNLIGGADALDGDWFAGSAATAAIADDAGGLGAGNALRYVSSGTFSRVTMGLDIPVELTAAGDLVAVELRVRMTRFSVANNGGIRFGLHANNGVPITTANAGTGWSTNTQGWEGYYFRGGVGAETGMRIYRDVAEPGNNAVGGSGDVTVGNGTAWSLDDDGVHVIRLEVERLDNGQNRLRFFVDGDLKQDSSTTTVGGALAAFDQFTIGTGSTEVDLWVDDVVISLSDDAGSPLEPIDLSTRAVDWSRAGVEGVIPDYDTVINFAEAGGDPLGERDNSPRLQELIDGLSADTVIYFPAGIYRFNRRINLADSPNRNLPGVILRGAGPEATKLLFKDPVDEQQGYLKVSGTRSSTELPIVGGLTKGSTRIDLAAAGAVQSGDWLLIRQDNDPVAMATTRDIPDYAATIDNSTGWARRTVGQMVKVTGVNGVAVSLDRALHLDFTWPNPTATVVQVAEGVGFEDFTMEGGLATPGRNNIHFDGAVNCWVRNVHSLMTMRYHLVTFASANITVRDSYFNDAYRHDGGGHGYGTLLATASTHILVENNVFRNLRHSMIWKQGANGSVFAYNYSTDGNQEGVAIARDISGHGHYAFANLFEGNIVEAIHASDYWGPTGPDNFYVRNRVTGEGITIEDATRNQSIIGNELVSPTRPFVSVDGSSTGAYIHGNREGGLLQWRADAAQSVVDSYHYAAEPDYWDIADPWPSLGPEYSAGTYTIPAKERWDQQRMNEFVPPAAAGRLTNLSTRGRVSANGDGLIAGFVLSGGTARTILIRAVGPALGEFLDPSAVAPDPQLILYRGSDVVASNDDWFAAPNAAEIVTSSLAVGAFALPDPGLDAAILTDLAPGAYSAHLDGPNGGGIALIELYDAGGDDETQLLNISTRGRVGNGNAVMLPGIVVGEQPRRLLIRGVGPELATSFGFAASTVLPDPVLTLKDASGGTLATNDDWSDGEDAAGMADVAQRVGAFALTEGGRDASLLITVGPGVYTAQVEDANDLEGIAIVEIYAVP